MRGRVVRELPEDLREEYPFPSRFFQIQGGHRLHYVDVGTDHHLRPPVLLIHGNPTWSFYYRNLIKTLALERGLRVIAPDHMGCGLSERPQNYPYTLANHAANLNDLIAHLGLKEFFLVVHDWGGAIGLAQAMWRPEAIKGLVILNTAAFIDRDIPKRIALCRLPFIGGVVVRGLGGFARLATRMAVYRPMPEKIRRGYLFPYDTYKNRIANLRFVQDIPMEASHPSYSLLRDIEGALGRLSCPKLIAWGKRDFCFHMHFFHRWHSFYSEAECHVYEDAGHYVLEDAREEVNPLIANFFERTQRTL